VDDPATRGGRFMSAQERRVIAASAAGTVFEWYDFYLYGALAVIIGEQFFAAYSETQQAIFALLTFAAGFLVRPIGAVIFGRLGDMVGRKYTFVMTVTLMGAATFLVGLLPGYDKLGAAAPVCLVLLRMLQGLAAGGEYGGAAIYVAEHAPPDRRGYFTSFVNTTSALALLLALMVILFTQMTLDASYPPVVAGDKTISAFKAWGWRIPFLLSIILLGISLYIRLRMRESPAFERIRNEGQLSRAPLAEAFSQWPNVRLGLIALLGLVMGQAVVWYTGHFYSLFFLQNVLKVDQFTANVLMSWAILFSVPFAVIFASLSDRIGRKPVILGGCMIAAIAYFPLYEALTLAANPALYHANTRVKVSVIADPNDCSFQFNPTGAAKFRSSCDVAKSLLTKTGVRYTSEAAPAGSSARVKIETNVFDAASPQFAKDVTEALQKAGYPSRDDASIVRIPIDPAAGLANAKNIFDIASAQKIKVIAILWILMLFAGMAYGPMAAALVELFPVRIRYSAVSLPYHIGNGWFGGLLPATVFAMVAASGDIYFGLWYPVAVAALCAVIGILFVPEMHRNET